MKSDFLVAFTALAAERNLPKETVLSAIESALASAYRKDSVTSGHSLTVKLNPGTGEIQVYYLLTVVEEVEDPRNEISLEEAQKIKKDAALEEVLQIEAPPQTAGRIAAQTAKQAVIQRLREAERELIYEEYSGKEDDILTATIVRVEPKHIVLDMGRTEGILPISEQVLSERYRIGQKLKVYLVEVQHSSKGPEIILSRTHKGMLKRLFEMEVPEIFNGAVEIMSIAREPGSRSKVAVRARQENVDAVGSCVGLRGIRIQNIVNELQGEKIDVVQWHKEPSVYLANALSPAQVMRVDLNEEENGTLVVVPDRQLSLAIGKEGQNARLAAKLTGWKVDIKSSTEAEEERLMRAAEGRDGAVEAAVAVAEPSIEEPALEEVSETEAPAVPETIEAPVAEAEVPYEEAALEEATVEEDADVISPEEALAVASLEPELQEVAPQEEAKSLEEIPEEVWFIPRAAPGPGELRFAEDILGPRAPRTKGRRGRRAEPQGEAEDKARKGGGGRRVSVPGASEDVEDGSS
jgi:N utilization substance protein A